MPRPTIGSLKERFSALRTLPPFLALVWRTSPSLTASSLLLRLVRALLPVATLYVGKLIIDEVVRLAQTAGHGRRRSRDWLASGRLDRLGWLLAAEFGLAVLSDVLGRVVSLLDSLLSERFTNATSLRLMEHAATLDLEDFEDSELQDRLERARRQASGPHDADGQLFGQAQDVVTIASFAAGLFVYAPWLIVLLLLALVPAFLGEAHFNAQSYSLNYARTPERRELDYVRQTGASVETAKEVKIFGLNAFLIERYRALAAELLRGQPAARDAPRRLGRRCSRRSAPSATTSPTPTSPGARCDGEFTIGDLTFLAGSFRRLRTLLEGLLIGFSQMAGQALYLDDLFSFFEIEPEIVSPANPRPFPRRSARASRSRTSASAIPAPSAGRCATSTSRCSAGEVLALVGENGAGKTTLVKLLARLYDPDEGRILLDGHDLREYDLDELRAQHRRHLPGLRALPLHRRREHRRRPHRGARRPRAHRARGRAAAWPTT